MNKLVALLFFGAFVAATQAILDDDIHDKTSHRNLKEYFDETNDLCDNGSDDGTADIELGECDFSKFPKCENGKEFICYNRKASRDRFHPDNHQPHYYIQYNRVMCYPMNFEGCSSCSPGRYCASERRCILEELNYPCAQWY